MSHAINATNRNAFGSKEASIGIKNGKIPVVVYGKGKQNVNALLDFKELQKMLEDVSIFSKLIELNLDGKKITTMLKNVDFHPVTDKPRHVDFMFAENNSIVTTQVPISVLNKDKCVGIKRGGKFHMISYVLPVVGIANKIPEMVEVDIANVGMGNVIRGESIPLPEGVKLAKPCDILSVSGKQDKEEDEEVKAPEPAQPAADAKKEPAKKK